MEPRKAVPMKNFALEYENDCEEEVNLTPQDRIGNIDWWKCGRECKLMVRYCFG